MADMNGFDASQHEPKSFETVKPGWYPCCAIESDLKETKSGTGSYYEFVFEIQEGEFKGRRLWARLTKENQNQVAVDIGADQLAALCQAAGVLRPKATEDLHYKPVDVKVTNRKWEGELKEEVKGFRPLAGVAPAGSVAGSSGARDPQTNQAKKPWG